ncbi:amino acid deaminase [Devosia sp. LjRoot3]|uniref:amino acid deaminase n=1 Tax=Devosia sp. LjRoot3 TaxID=3342319 RepID=UPI003ECE23A8
MHLDALQKTLLDGRTKGIPATAEPFALKDIAGKGWNVLREDLPMPLMLLKRSALDHNASVFGQYLTSHNLSLAPHGKTTMSPQIFSEQLAGGAWGMTAATVNQVQVMHHYGVKRVLLANQLIGKAHLAGIAALIDADPEFEFSCFLDSAAQLDNMLTHLRDLAPTRPIKALLEIGAKGGRTGLRTEAEALALADKLASSDQNLVRFAGIATFEGVVPGIDKDPMLVEPFAQSIVDIARALPKSLYAGLDEFILSGGGSSYFDIVADRFSTLDLPLPVRVLLRSGCYVTNDSGAYKKAQDEAKADPRRSWKSDLQPALEAWAYVQSMPEPGLAFLSMGKRDVPYDSGLPVPFKRYRPGIGFLPIGEATIFATNDQHAYVRLGPDTDWQVGDLVASGVSHPCTAFDKWRFLPIVDDDYTVIDGVLTFF